MNNLIWSGLEYHGKEKNKKHKTLTWNEAFFQIFSCGELHCDIILVYQSKNNNKLLGAIIQAWNMLDDFKIGGSALHVTHQYF